MERRVPLGLSNKHIHLCQEDLEILFGEGHELTPKKFLVQPGQYAALEKVDIVGPKNTLAGVRVLGPVRPETQLEINITDGVKLGIHQVPIRLSGALEGTPGFTIIGPKGKVVKEKGMIVAERHIHMSTEEGSLYNLKDGDVVSVRLKGPRGLLYNNVLVRVGDKHRMEMHIDIEEGNAAGARNGQLACIVDTETATIDYLTVPDDGSPLPMVGDLPEKED